MPRNQDANGNALSLNASQTAARYWKDTFGNARHFTAVRTAGDVIRELHYKCVDTLYKKCLRDLETLVSSNICPDKVGAFVRWMEDDADYISQDTYNFLLLSLCGAVDIPDDDWEVIARFKNNATMKELVLGSTTPQYTSYAFQCLDRFSDELDATIPSANAAAAAVKKAREDADKRIKDCEDGVAQTKEILKEERKMVRQLEKIITANGIDLPKQCACGEIYEPENCVEKVEYKARVVKVLDEETGEIIEEAETLGGKVELYRPLYHHHWNGREQCNENFACHRCIFGAPENCSPCFVPQPKKVEFIAAKMYGKAYEYSPPQCFCCMNGIDKRNCFVWNKNRYLLVPQFAACLPEIVAPRALRDNTYTKIRPSAFREVQADKGVPVMTISVKTTTGTDYFGDYQYENTTGNRVCVRPLR